VSSQAIYLQADMGQQIRPVQQTVPVVVEDVMLNNLRLKHGMFWQRRYPTPLDYKQESRFVGALILILVMLWLLASRFDYEAALVQEEVIRESYQQMVLACLNQAHNGGNVGVVFDDKLYGVNCMVLSNEPYKNLKSM
jgi:hypothetical protein